MKITIGVTSYNRGLYLNALLHSIRDEVWDDEHQLIVVDNASDEDAVIDAIDAHRDVIDAHYMQRNQNWINDEYIAKNLIIEKAEHDVILFLQDDMQYVGPPGYISDNAEALMDSNYLVTSVNPVRRSTLAATVSNRVSKCGKLKLWEHSDQHYFTTGFFKKHVFADVGLYGTTWPLDRAYWGHSEDDYDRRVKARFPNQVISAAAQIPTFLPVWNDPRGGYAFNRDGRRWGHYAPPVTPFTRYYDSLTVDEEAMLSALNRPCSFVDVAKPLGWKLALDPTGDIKKYPQLQIMKEG